jgi:hypothetical protein
LPEYYHGLDGHELFIASRWSIELIQARTIVEAIKKYEQLVKGISTKEEREVRTVELLGNFGA